MKNRKIVLLFAALLSLGMQAAEVSHERAAAVAKVLMADRVDGFEGEVQSVKTVWYEGQKAYHVVQFAPAGWMLISADDQSSPLIGYSPDTVFPEEKDMPENMQGQMNWYSDQVVNIGSKTLISSLIMIAMVVVSALGLMPLLQCAVIAAIAMVVLRCCNVEQAVRAVNWDILMVFAGSVVLGLAIQKTGIAERWALGILDVCGTNPIIVMTAICLVGTFITEFISNTAAGAMFFPIMYQAAEKMGYDPFPFLIALMISVSSSFATPIGSPTHMLVYGPGGYRFQDFMRIGLLMNLIILAANIFIVNIVYPLTPLH